jgi:pimeloyl-ACP methyl ester carboxylesterase
VEPLVVETPRRVATERPPATTAGLDHTLGATSAVIELPPSDGVPGARLAVLRWRPASGAGDPRRASGLDSHPRRWGRRRTFRQETSREVVMLHGLSGSAATQAPVAAALAAEGWSVRAIDLPGHGRSRWLGEDGLAVPDPESLDPGLYGLDRIARTVARAIDALGLDERPILVGHSWGAGIAVATVLERAPVSRLILVDPPFLSVQGALDLANDLAADLSPDLEEARAVAIEAEPNATEIDLAARAEALSQASALAVRSAASQTGYGPFELLSRWRAAKPAITVDVICGSPANGGLVPARARLALWFFLGRGRVHYLRDAGHSPQNSHFAQFMTLLRRLLRGG